jgi:hypothetical protein
MSDASYPGARKQMRKGAIIINDMVLIRTSREFSPGALTNGPYSDLWGGEWYGYSGDLAVSVEAAAPYPAVINHDGDKMRQIALTKVYANINKSGIMAGEVMSDIGMTMQMLRRPFGGAVKLVGKMLTYRNRNIGKTAASAAKASANAWLEYRYGWRPLVTDAMKVISDVEQIKLNYRPPRLVARSQETDGSTMTVSFADVLLPNSSLRASGTCSRFVQVRASAGVLYQSAITGSTSAAMAKVLGTRTRDLPATVWEVIPFSFVMDWFVNVGDWVQAVTPNPEVQILGHWTTVVREEKLLLSSTGLKQQNGSHTATGDWGSSTRTTVQVDRAANRPLPTTPVLKSLPLSRHQAVDAAALLVNQVKLGLGRLRH